MFKQRFETIKDRTSSIEGEDKVAAMLCNVKYVFEKITR